MKSPFLLRLTILAIALLLSGCATTAVKKFGMLTMPATSACDGNEETRGEKITCQEQDLEDCDKFVEKAKPGRLEANTMAVGMTAGSTVGAGVGYGVGYKVAEFTGEAVKKSLQVVVPGVGGTVAGSNVGYRNGYIVATEANKIGECVMRRSQCVGKCQEDYIGILTREVPVGEVEWFVPRRLQVDSDSVPLPPKKK